MGIGDVSEPQWKNWTEGRDSRDNYFKSRAKKGEGKMVETKRTSGLSNRKKFSQVQYCRQWKKRGEFHHEEELGGN